LALMGAVEMRYSLHFVEKNREADAVVAENTFLRRYGPLII
jgi:hypothetical protein